MDFNFDNVESASEVNGGVSTFKSVKPGLQTLMIKEMQSTTAGTGTPGVVVTFESAEADASFNHTFWLSPGALSRIQYLVEKFTGVKLSGSLSGELDDVVGVLASKLVGKSRMCIVDGEMRTREKDGKVYTNTYPTLRFAGFVDPEGTAAEPIINDRTAPAVAKAASSNIVNDLAKNDDVPF